MNGSGGAAAREDTGSRLHTSRAPMTSKFRSHGIIYAAGPARGSRLLLAWSPRPCKSLDHLLQMRHCSITIHDRRKGRHDAPIPSQYELLQRAGGGRRGSRRSGLAAVERGIPPLLESPEAMAAPEDLDPSIQLAETSDRPCDWVHWLKLSGSLPDFPNFAVMIYAERVVGHPKPPVLQASTN